MSSRYSRLFEVMSEGIILKWWRILDAARDLGVVSEEDLRRSWWFLHEPWRMYSVWELDYKITRLHEINGAVKATLSRQAAAEVAEARRAIDASRRAIAVQQDEEKNAETAIQRLENVHQKMRELGY